MPFRKRADVRRHLAATLLKYKGGDVVMLALPRGGVPAGAEIAAALGAPMDLVLVRKLGAPFHEELAMGAVAEGEPPVTVRNDDVISILGVCEAAFHQVLRKELAEKARRRRAYLAGRASAEVAGRVAIVVNDGVATGPTMPAALRAVRARGPRRLALAVPVCEADVLATLRQEADEIVCLEDHLVRGGVRFCYDDFRQISDSEVTRALAQFPPSPPAPPPGG